MADDLPPGYTPAPAEASSDLPKGYSPAPPEVPTDSGQPPQNPSDPNADANSAVSQKLFDQTPAGAFNAAVQGFTANSKQDINDITGFTGQITDALRKAGVYNNTQDFGTERESFLKNLNEAVLKPASLAAVGALNTGVNALNEVGGAIASVTPDWAQDIFMAYAAAGEPLPTEQIGDIARAIPPLEIRPVLEPKPWQVEVTPNLPAVIPGEEPPPGAPPEGPGGFQSSNPSDNNPTIISGLPRPGTPEAEAAANSTPSRPNETIQDQEPLIDGSGNLNLKYIRADEDIVDFAARAAQQSKERLGLKISMDQMAREGKDAVAESQKDMAYGVPDIPAWRYPDEVALRQEAYVGRTAALQWSAVSVRLRQAAVASGDPLDMQKWEDTLPKFGNAEATRSMRAEASGRLQKAQQLTIEVPGSPITEDAAQKLHQMYLNGVPTEQIGQVMDTLTTPRAVTRFMGDLKNPKITDYLQYFVFNNWLSGLLTHMSYWGSNIFQNAIRVAAEKPVAALVGKAQEFFGEGISPGQFRSLSLERGVLQKQLSEAISAQGKPMEPLEMQKALNRISAIERTLEQKQTYKLRETQAHIMGMAEGGMDALRAAGQAFKTGERIPLPGEAAIAEDAANAARVKALSEGKTREEAEFAAQRVFQDSNPQYGNPFLQRAETIEKPGLNILGIKIPVSAAIKKGTMKVAGNIIGAPMMRMINGLHTFQQHLTYAESLYGNTMRQVLNEGRTGKLGDTTTNLGQRFAVLKNKPSVEMMQKAAEDGKYAVYLEKSGLLARNIQKAANTNGYTRFVIPFSKVPMNIFKQRFIERTPFGLLDPRIQGDIMGKHGNLAQADTIARMSVGSAIMGTGAYLAYQKINHGFVSDDKNTRFFRNLNGTSPYSVSIAGVNIPHRFLGNAGAAMSIGADMHDAAQAHQEGAKGYEHLISVMGESLRHTALNAISESGLTGLSEVLGAITDDRGQASKYISNSLVSAFQPYSSFQHQINNTPFIDPIIRQTLDKDAYTQFINTWKSYTLGQSTSLTPEFDIFGNELRHGGDHSWAEKDPVYQALDYLRIYPSVANRHIFNTTLNDEQYASFARAKGQIFYNAVRQDMANPNWVRMAPKDQAAYVFQAVKDSEKQAHAAMTAWYPDLVTQSKSRTKALLDKYDNWNPDEGGD